ncbi:MAG: hypothetical protein LBC73_00555, partial [Oscillospiraceae bacterium]|nr:hypothetical protein [Oscillospiraceae bacterium]
VNPGFNEDLKQKSVDLNQYSIFTNRVQENIDKGLLLVNAIKETIRWSIEQGILSSYLTKHESEVENMLYTEWNWDDAKEIWQEEAREDGVIEGLERGRKQGHKEGQIKGLKEGIDKVLSLIKSGLSIEEVEKIISDKQ